MPDFETPFLTFTQNPSDPNFMGEIEELAAMNRRVEALDKALRSGKEFDVLLDMLAEDGQDPCAYVDSVGMQIEYMIANGIVPDDIGYWKHILHDS